MSRETDTARTVKLVVCMTCEYCVAIRNGGSPLEQERRQSFLATEHARRTGHTTYRTEGTHEPGTHRLEVR